MSVTIRCVVQVRAIASLLLAKCERSIGQKAVVAATLIVVYKGASLYVTLLLPPRCYYLNHV